LEPAIAFGKVVRQFRLSRGLTQEQLGFEADLRRTYVSILELGQQQPSLSTILKISKALGCSAQELIAAVEAAVKNDFTQVNTNVN
jgi:transcriptional regulator with XRE-family HTH domain